MSRTLMIAAACLYFLAAAGPIPPHMRVVLMCYGVANIALAWAV